jgi:hypothetical protein
MKMGAKQLQMRRDLSLITNPTAVLRLRPRPAPRSMLSGQFRLNPAKSGLKIKKFSLYPFHHPSLDPTSASSY